MAKKVYEESNIAAIANVIREKTGLTTTYKTEQMASGVRDVYAKGHSDGSNFGMGAGYNTGYSMGVADGKQAEYDAFWDAYQQNGNRVSYEHGFGGAGWTNETFCPKYDIRPTTAYMLFRYSGIEGDLVEILERLGRALDFSQCTNTQYMMAGSKITRIGVIDLRNNPNAADGMFQNCTSLKTIDLIKLTDEQNDVGGMFTGLNNLETIAFEGTIGNSISFKNSAKLTTASVQSIIDHLKDLTGQGAQILTFHAAVGGKLTQAQKDAISAKNWTLVY